MKKFGVFVFLTILVASIFLSPISAKAAPSLQSNTPWCGATSETQNYGFTFPLTQDHWTVNGEDFVSQAAIDEVDALYDALNNDNIINGMILFMDAKEVANPPVCAGNFNTYMKLGNYNGPRVDNGFTILFTVTRNGAEIQNVQLNYALGGNLEKLLPDGLQEMKRLTAKTFDETKSLDKTYLAVAHYLNEYARSKYQPYHPSSSDGTDVVSPTTNPTNDQSTPGFMGILSVLCLLFFVFLGLIFLAWVFSKLGIDLTTTSPGTGRPTTNNNYHHTPSPRRQTTTPPSQPRRKGGGSGNTSRVG